MPLDTSIALQVRQPQFEDPTNAMARVLQLRQLQDQGEASKFDMQMKRDAVERNSKMRDILMGGGDADALQRAGYLTEANAWRKAEADAAKDKATANKTSGEVVNQRIALYRDNVGNVNDPQTALDYVKRMRADPLLKDTPIAQVPIEHVVAQLPADPSGMEAWKQKFSLGATKYIEMNAPKYTTSNTGGQTVTTAIGGLDGQARTVQTLNNTQSPDNKASVGAQMANAAATREVASATREAAGVKDRRDTEMKLADDYRAQAKNYKDVEDAAARVKSALATATKSAPATLSAATSFMKLLDPGSVVRESELVMALQASGMLDRALNSFNILQNGKVLTKQQAEEFGKVTDTLLQAARQQQQKLDTHYRGTAERNGLRPEMVIQDIGQNSDKFRVLGVEK